jgi:cation diffusion facilitator family transporter
MQADKKFEETRISYTELALSLMLTLFKLLAGLLGNSTLLLADSVRSFSEFINECIRLLDISIASKPEDKSHNYGHGKITTLFMGAGAFILLFANFRAISLSSGELLMFLQGKEPEIPEIIAFYAAITAFVLRNIMAALTENTVARAKGASSKARIPIKDLLISGFIILGTGCTFLPGKGFDIADSFAAFLLSLYLLGISGRLLYRTANELIEASLDEENNLRIREIINKTENVTGSGELKTRRVGKGIAINACVYVDNSLSICEAAEISNLVEERLKAAFTEDVYVLIKIEPSQEKNQALKNKGRSSEERRRNKVTSL